MAQKLHIGVMDDGNIVAGEVVIVLTAKKEWEII